MQKIEKWRIQELTQVLNRLAAILREGKNSDWANVFDHFAQEAHRIVQNEKFDLDILQKLIHNMRNCFDGTSSLHSLVLTMENTKKMEELNQEFIQTKGLLFMLLSDLEKKGVEPIN
ncbi:MAG: hypothetical protein OEW23_05185 [Candidatus Aminicenantes bacterium]|jgi:hypothetical protein|nr:hypothetical protein [Candidatus Aminicenantes bacterium]